MPIIRMDVSERPNHILPSQSRLDLRILTDVKRIVEINKTVLRGFAEDDPNQGDNYAANNEADPTGRYSRLTRIRFHDGAKEYVGDNDRFPAQVWRQRSGPLERKRGLLQPELPQQRSQTGLLRRKPLPAFGE